ncbi:YdcF family protein [Clostridium niameyense]|uniref:YdcF family protein n=1 Tax=Clostridium niameyense TaxID=1622073 RepID=A0A6M0R6K9_9CLOT|nr:YdcF family protein [Clostridium niameyense]NEZ45814.1 YdcF family protein [Clostridium niameyense]
MHIRYNKFLKYIERFIIFVFIVVTFLAFQIVHFSIREKPVKSDCIIVLGCKVKGSIPTPFLACRIDEAIRLHKKGFSKYIIVSGGQGPGEDISEAKSMKEYLIKNGINKEFIIIEDKSINTLENIKYSKEKMAENKFKSAIIVSNKYHLKRASLVCKKENIEASYSGILVKSYISYEIIGFLREIPALLVYYIIIS